MACGLLLQPAGAATAAVLWPCLLLPATRRSFPNKVQLNQVHCMNQLRWKQFLSAAKSQRSRSLVGCSSSDSSAEVAALSRPADFSTAQSDQSMTRCVDLVPGTANDRSRDVEMLRPVHSFTDRSSSSSTSNNRNGRINSVG
ncbi:hypothetical protein SETIT_2G426800v2 [Setaria italica]|uniref:Secreted protein n=2 Tax=Setaria TaxID=4554 RepID=A0A368Q8V5_SETIT|nr:hypothetical protein SETIT_2G426800v2 [Setaria italica]TKW36406.1 hypothetical protein SEVIR_2G438300v2 [Setaria viridis]